ncbi:MULTISPECIES: hypothetical protein [Rhodococcus]|uniref:hypothetical protein n=1 Tax=Rhodococcus TaxID=1827 RepID=UPI0012F4D152|nr:MULTISPECIES: hypothetical protein [Rhodococcus]
MAGIVDRTEHLASEDDFTVGTRYASGEGCVDPSGVDLLAESVTVVSMATKFSP